MRAMAFTSKSTSVTSNKQDNTELDIIDSILYVKIASNNNPYGGYKAEILLNSLSPLEENFLKCSTCKGLMRDAHITNSGQKIKCKNCFVNEEVGHSLGPSNLTIEQLGCECPLSERGCNWQGVISGVYKHLDTCGHVVVECSNLKFGCTQIMMRLELEQHRTDRKDYHSELVSVFMATRVEQLEVENKRQIQKIAEIEAENKRQNQKITELERKLANTESKLASVDKIKELENKLQNLESRVPKNEYIPTRMTPTQPNTNIVPPTKSQYIPKQPTFHPFTQIPPN